VFLAATVALPLVAFRPDGVRVRCVRPAAYVIGTSEQRQWRSLRSPTTSFEGTMRSISGSASTPSRISMAGAFDASAFALTHDAPSSPDWASSPQAGRGGIWREGGPWIFASRMRHRIQRARRWALQSFRGDELLEKPSIAARTWDLGFGSGSAPFGSRRRRPGLNRQSLTVF